MANDDWERARRGVSCPNCGASNWPDARACASCGQPLPAPGEHAGEPTIIDVSAGPPHVLAPDEPAPHTPPAGGFTSMRWDQGRAVVVRGGRRGCLLVTALLALLLCCGCWFLWYGAASLF